MTDTATVPPPGWYPDPAEPARQRWWSGIGWTDHVQDPAPPAVPDQQPPSAPVAAPEGPTTSTPAGGSVALATPLPTAMTTEDQLAWHREPEPARPAVATVSGSFAGFGDVAPAPVRGFSNYREVYAPPPDNRAARRGIVYAVLAILFNLLMIPSIASIVYGGRGLREARQIEAMGHPSTVSRRGTATVVLVVGIVMTVISAISIPVGVVTAINRIPHYDQTALQKLIVADVLSQSGMRSTVVCPASEPYTNGTQFDCSITLTDGRTLGARVQIGSGGYRLNYIPASQVVVS